MAAAIQTFKSCSRNYHRSFAEMLLNYVETKYRCNYNNNNNNNLFYLEYKFSYNIIYTLQIIQLKKGQAESPLGLVKSCPVSS